MLEAAGSELGSPRISVCERIGPALPVPARRPAAFGLRRVPILARPQRQQRLRDTRDLAAVFLDLRGCFSRRHGRAGWGDAAGPPFACRYSAATEAGAG